MGKEKFSGIESGKHKVCVPGEGNNERREEEGNLARNFQEAFKHFRIIVEAGPFPGILNRRLYLALETSIYIHIYIHITINFHSLLEFNQRVLKNYTPREKK